MPDAFNRTLSAGGQPDRQALPRGEIHQGLAQLPKLPENYRLAEARPGRKPAASGIGEIPNTKLSASGVN